MASQDQAPDEPFGDDFAKTFSSRKSEADEFYRHIIGETANPEQRLVSRLAYAGLLWTKHRCRLAGGGSGCSIATPRAKPGPKP